MQFYHSNLLNSLTNLTHAFTTKDIGNIAFHVNDTIQNVNDKHIKLSKILDYNHNSLVYMKQIHSSTVHIVTDNDNFSNPHECDALITNKKNTPLMVMVADCSPILFYDARKKVIAVAHAGRQGAFKNIVHHTLESMKKNFHSSSEDIYVSIGPSIKSCCYEVGSEIYDEACQFNLDYALKNKNNHYYLDISKILKSQLLASNIKEVNIEISSECTCCKHDTYFSYRADVKTGRFCGLIMLK